MTEYEAAIEQSRLTQGMEAVRLTHERGMEADRLSHERSMEADRLASDLRSQRISCGVTSVLFGTGAEKSGNIAGIALVLMALMIAGIMIFDRDNPATASCFSVVTLALGYLFGRAGADNSSNKSSSGS